MLTDLPWSMSVSYPAIFHMRERGLLIFARTQGRVGQPGIFMAMTWLQAATCATAKHCGVQGAVSEFQMGVA